MADLDDDEEFIRFEVKEIKDGITLVQFELERELEPNDLKKVEPPDPVKNKFSTSTVILVGRGPIWLYGFLVHYYHPVRAIAVFDPRLNGAVVVESHVKALEVGNLIKMEG